MPRLPLLLLALLLSGCAAMRASKAREHIDRGEYEAALSLWERRLLDAPDDAQALAGRREVVGLMLGVQLASAKSHREAGRHAEALKVLAVATATGARAGGDLPALTAERKAELGAVRSAVDDSLSVGQPLAASRLLAPLEPLLGPVGASALGRELRAAVRDVGRRRCAAVLGVARTPYLQEAAGQYCAKVEAPAPAPPVTPERRAGLSVEVTAAAFGTPAVTKQLVDAAVGAFGRSPWADPRAVGNVAARLSGAMESRGESTPLELTVSWPETQTYTEQQSVTESYQESYLATETYTYSCGTGTQYRTCTGTRSVTRTRPATRTVQKLVTKTRTVTRSMTYPAVQKAAWHRAQVVAAVALPGTTKALELSWDDSYEKKDFEHDTTNLAADVKPKKAEVATPEEWAGKQARALYEKLGVRLREAWTASFCRAGEQTPEEAARCLAGAVGPQPDAQAVLTRFLGE